MHQPAWRVGQLPRRQHAHARADALSPHSLATLTPQHRGAMLLQPMTSPFHCHLALLPPIPCICPCVCHGMSYQQYLKSIRLERNRKTGFKCPRGCGKGSRHPEPCPGKIDKSHPIHPRNEEQKKKKKVREMGKWGAIAARER